MLNTLSSKVANLSPTRINQAVIAIILAISIVVMAQQLLSIYRTSSYQPLISVAKSDQGSTIRQDYNVQTITRSNLFGNLTNDRQSLNNFQLPTTQLQFQLRGAFTSTNPKLGSAIIEGPNQQVRSFKVDSSVFGSAKLHAVFSDRIVLSINGQLETLFFPEPSSALQSAPAPETSALTTQNGSQVASPPPSSKTAAMTPEQRKKLIRKRLLDLRNRNRDKK